MFQKPSLQFKILILVTIVTVLMTSIIVSFDTYTLRKSVQEAYVSQLDGMKTAINGRYEESHNIEDVQQIFDYIQYKTPNVLQLTLYGKQTVLASTERNRIGTPSPAKLLKIIKFNETLVSHIRNEKDGIPKDRLTAPFKEDGVTIGAIELLIDTSDSAASINDRTQIIIIVALAATILLLISLSFIIRILLIHPLLRIREAATTFRKGLTYKQIKLDASYEITEVASAFNDMVSDLDGRYNELESAMNTIKRTQKQLVESEKMVALGNLVAGVSHEINTPIGIGVTAVSYMDEKTRTFHALFLDNKMKKSDLDDYLKMVLETTGMIQTNLQRASELIKSFKQVAVDRSAQTKRKFKIKPYIQEVLVSLQPNIKKTKHQVRVHGDDALQLFTDPGAISQVITNLIMNSIIHAYSNEDRGTIKIELTQIFDGLTIQYSDDGKGMTKNVVEQIFNPFFTTNRSGGGTGLGMHIVYNLVTQSLAGTIICESTVGFGTIFIIQIPMNEG